MSSRLNETFNTDGREFVPQDVVPAQVVDTMQLEIDEAAGGATWTFVSLTQEVAQIALDAVGYQPNYSRSVTSRLCLHYINTIRKRVSGGLTNYLFNVDGCVSSLVEATGRCEIYYCRPYTYELQVKQKAVGSDVFIVQSIYKTVEQKTLDEYRNEESNLEWTTAAETGEQSIFSPLETSVQSDQTATGQIAYEEDFQPLFDNEDTISWTSTDVPDRNISMPPLVIQHDTIEPLSLEAEPVVMSSLDTGKTIGGPASTAIVGVVGIATVSVAAFAVVVALGLKQLRSRINAAKRAANQAYPPLVEAKTIICKFTEKEIGAELA